MVPPPPIEPALYLVDDDEAIRDSLAMRLAAEGWTAQAFASAIEFLDRLDPARLGCVIADIRMPSIDGLELMARLRGLGLDWPVIVISGHADVPLAVRAMRAGAIDLIEKPLDDAALIAAVRRGMGRAHAMALSAEDGRMAERIGRLTPRERDVLACLLAGSVNKVIASRLGISPRTVEIHRARVMDKIGARSLSDVVRAGLKAGVQPRID